MNKQINLGTLGKFRVFIDVDSPFLGFLDIILYFKGTHCSYLCRMPRLTQPCAPLDSEVVNFFTDPKARADKRLKKVDTN